MECSKIYVHLNDVFRRVHIYMFSLAQDDYIVCLCVIIMIHFLDSSTEVVACLNGEQGMVQFLQLHHINSLLEFEMSNCPIWSLTKASHMVGRAQRAWLLRFGEVGCPLVTCPFSMPILQKMNWPPLEYLPVRKGPGATRLWLRRAWTTSTWSNVERRSKPTPSAATGELPWNCSRPWRLRRWWMHWNPQRVREKYIM